MDERTIDPRDFELTELGEQEYGNYRAMWENEGLSKFDREVFMAMMAVKLNVPAEIYYKSPSASAPVAIFRKAEERGLLERRGGTEVSDITNIDLSSLFGS